MDRTLLIDLSEDLYASIQREAAAQGTTPARLAATSLERQFSERPTAPGEAGAPAEAEQQAEMERFEQHFGGIDLGYATGADNESIDADLARQYAANLGDT